MVRVGHLIASEAVHGGLRTVVEALCALDPDGQVVLHANPSSGRLPRLREAWPLPAPGLDAPLLRAARAVDVLVVHGVFNPACTRVARQVVGLSDGPAVVAFPHDPYDEGLLSTRPFAKRAYLRVAERPWLAQSKGVLVTAPSHKALLRRQGVHVPVCLRPLGLTEHEHLQAAASLASRAGRSEGRRLLFLGRWDVHEKGLDLLFTALAEIAGQEADLRLRLVGPPGGARDELAARVARSGAPVDLVGFVDDVWAELRAADLLVLPSRKEGFGLAGLQALAAGVPVLLSSRAGLAEVVGEREGVVLVRPEARDIQEGLTAALGDLPGLTSRARTFAAGRASSMTYRPVLQGLVELGTADP